VGLGRSPGLAVVVEKLPCPARDTPRLAAGRLESSKGWLEARPQARETSGRGGSAKSPSVPRYTEAEGRASLGHRSLLSCDGLSLVLDWSILGEESP